MATHTSKVLFFNQLTNLLAPVLSPSGVKYHVQLIKLFNANTTEELVEFDFDDGVVGPFYTEKVAVKPGDTVCLTFGGCGDVVDDGHIVQAKSTISAMVTCKIVGFEIV